MAQGRDAGLQSWSAVMHADHHQTHTPLIVTDEGVRLDRIILGTGQTGLRARRGRAGLRQNAALALSVK